jgi:hypothetical protein
MLKERLNVGEEAIDYFRASSLILKAGVKAGLSLYQIAIMCCRNDDMGEEPSLLERLTDMAGELAEQVVGNDQWHHATASRAVVDQLTPKRSSYVNPLGFKSRFPRSVSSGEFRTLSSQNSNDSDTKTGGSPPMAQSSGSSDSGNDSFVSGTGDQEDVEEWAQSLLEDSFVHMHVTPPRRSRRSSSVTSDDASNDSSGSPKGFWQVRPGSPPNGFLDEDSVNWSPEVTSHPTFQLGEEDPPLHAKDPLSRRRSVQFSEKVDQINHESGPTEEVFLLPPAVIEAPSTGLATTTAFKREDSSESNGMRRSKSYTPFTRSSSMEGDQHKLAQSAGLVGQGSSANMNSVEDREYTRTYFLKFIDLVISREMRRLVTENSEK